MANKYLIIFLLIGCTKPEVAKKPVTGHLVCTSDNGDVIFDSSIKKQKPTTTDSQGKVSGHCAVVVDE